MLVRGAGETFNLIVPVRRMREWAKTMKVEWALDDAVPVPSNEDIDKIPVEDTSVRFNSHGKTHTREHLNLSEIDINALIR